MLFNSETIRKKILTLLDLGTKHLIKKIQAFNMKAFIKKLLKCLWGAILLAGPFFLVVLYGSVIVAADKAPQSDGLLRYIYIFFPSIYASKSFMQSLPSFWEPFGHYIGYFFPAFLLWWALTFIIGFKRATQLFYLISLLIALMHLFSLLSIDLFLNTSGILSTFFTNTQEFLEVLPTYFSLTSLTILIILFVISWRMYCHFSQTFLANDKRPTFLRKCLLVISLLSLIPWLNPHNQTSIRTYNIFVQIPYVLYKGLRKQSFAEFRDHIKDTQKNTAQNRVYVFVLGESVTRLHQHAYGYSRPTTPFFDSNRELVLFSNAIAPYPSTALVTHYVFTRGPYEHTHEARQAFNVLRRGGFYTSYITTQSASGTAFRQLHQNFDQFDRLEFPYYKLINGEEMKVSFWDSLLGYLKGLLKKAFPSGEPAIFRKGNFIEEEPPLSQRYTGDILAVQSLDKMLKQTKNKKKRFFFIHLEDCHIAYRYRLVSKSIPKVFRKKTIFNRPLPKNFVTAGVQVTSKDDPNATMSTKVSYYDTCLAYSNRVLKEMIHRLEQEKNTQSFLVYESDHGEDLFQTSTSFGHSHYKGRAVFDIPFVLWTNSAYRKAHPKLITLAKARKKAPFMTDVLPFILYNLSDIKLNGKTDFSFSPLSPSFNPHRKRIIGYGFKNIDYDKVLKNQKRWYK